jgi:CheY-like chemotaxis protein
VPRIIGHVGPQRTLLVADDIAENRQFLHDLCSEWGFQVLVTEDGAEALAICRNTNPPPACVLVDQFMPGMDGWAFLRELRTGKDLRDLPVILVSAAEPRRPTGVPAEIDFDRVLLKPIRQQDLAESVGRLLGLEWILEQVVEEPKMVSGTAGKGSAEQLAALRGMLELGRVVAIQRWAEDLAETRPDLAEFGAELAVSAEKVDLSGLEEILKRAEEHAPDSPT